MPAHVAIVTPAQALELLTEFELRIRVGERPRDMVPAMETDRIVMLLAAAKEVRGYAALLDRALTEYLVDQRGADPSTMRCIKLPKAGAHG